MNGETWPKEEQRLCNGACGQVRAVAIDGEAFPLPQQVVEEANIAIDIADHMAEQSMDYARNAIGLNLAKTAHVSNVVHLAAAHLECASRVYVARQHVDALRDVGIENAGAIDSAGTVIGAGLAEGLQVACNGRTCRRRT
ncbi:hypothetical protein CHU94_11410 [Rhodoferax sp. TH121]|uniref:hypothetical protein n=1 Tax=Rhodoferax sp. TH121 TaxID=2022803 RepID=UPI000B96703E|nr:hypothetical protein [Rhodoferax sp. TH121]OYQ39941.1 hypothetical protein CHU94_11410 [Rhodoferax sp. TH121]